MLKRVVLVSILLLTLLASTVSAKGLDIPQLSLASVNSASEAPTTPMATCTPKTGKVMSGSYQIFQAPYPTWIDYQVKYDVKSNCSVVNISDRVRYRGPIYSEIGMTWFKSCTNGTSSCLSRNINVGFYYVNTWTSWKSLPNSTIGSQYRNYSGFVPTNMSYGYTYFGN